MVTHTIKQEAGLTIAATTRVLPLLAIVWSASLWAASQYFVTTDTLEATAKQQRILQLEDKIHDVKNQELRGSADNLDRSDMQRWEAEKNRLMREINK